MRLTLLASKSFYGVDESEMEVRRPPQPRHLGSDIRPHRRLLLALFHRAVARASSVFHIEALVHLFEFALVFIIHHFLTRACFCIFLFTNFHCVSLLFFENPFLLIHSLINSHKNTHEKWDR